LGEPQSGWFNMPAQKRTVGIDPDGLNAPGLQQRG
jgi:hypothetical protein